MFQEGTELKKIQTHRGDRVRSTQVHCCIVFTSFLVYCKKSVYNIKVGEFPCILLLSLLIFWLRVYCVFGWLLFGGNNAIAG